MSVSDIRAKQIEKLGQGALIICPCGQEHMMRLDEKRTCRCGRFYGYVEDEKAQAFFRDVFKQLSESSALDGPGRVEEVDEAEAAEEEEPGERGRPR